VKLKVAGDISPSSRTCADIAKSTKERHDQKLDPKTINRMISYYCYFTLDMHENRR
jgi:hypothetical protein